MKLFLLVVVVAVLLGLLLGGRISRLERLRPHWWGLVPVGLGLQFVPLPQGAIGVDLALRTTVLAISYALLITFAVANIRMKGAPLILVGLSLNAVVIVANGGMPVSADTLRASGQDDVVAWLETQGADKHHLLTDEDRLTILGDVIAVRQPIGQAISVGDISIYAGLIWAIVAAMRGQIPSSSSLAWGPYRGRHRQGEAQQTKAPTDLGFLPVTTRSGTGQ